MTEETDTCGKCGEPIEGDNFEWAARYKDATGFSASGAIETIYGPTLKLHVRCLIENRAIYTRRPAPEM